MKRLFLLGVVSALLLTGCGSYTVPPEKQGADITDAATTENPFEERGENIIGEIGHGPNEVNWTEDGEMIPFDYEGGEFSLSYHYSASGCADSVGFLLYLNGEPQPYKADGMEEFSYCHSFPVEGTTEKDITFRFTPVKGDAGDTLGLTILSIYYPDFKPDMVESCSYGFYQGILSNQVPVRFLADPPETMPLVTGLEAAGLKTRDEKITKDFLENELPANGVMEVGAIEEWPYYTISYDGELLLDNINLSGKESITVRYKLCGPEGTMAISQNGKQIAFAGMHGIYLYDFESKSASVLQKFEDISGGNGTGISILNHLAFSDNGSDVIYAGLGHSVPIVDGEDGFSIYGYTAVDGSSQQLTKKDSYEIDGFSVRGNALMMPQSFAKADGTLLMVDLATKVEKTFQFSSGQEGKDGIFFSSQGNYVATAVLGNGITIRIYDMNSGELLCEEMIQSVGEDYFYRIPQVMILDGSKSCIVLMGHTISDMDTAAYTFGF